MREGHRAGSIIYDHPSQLPSGLLASCRKQPLPMTLLMSPPDYFQVVDVKNPHMTGNLGRVDTGLARRQWEGVHDAFEASGAKVELVPPVEDCEDMVFCANQTFVGLGADGRRTCLLSNMKHESRQREVKAFARWFEGKGYCVTQLPAGAGGKRTGFEGSGDAIWHPGRALIWGGSGFRTAPEAYTTVSETFGVPVIRLPLRSDRFYHLDTCFAALSEDTALIHPRSLTQEGVAMIRAIFKHVIDVDDKEANEGMACNACAIGGKHVVIQKGNTRAVSAMKEAGFTVHEVDTSEYLKSGGSVFCMKMYVF